MSELRTYQAFASADAAQSLLELLETHQIPFETVYDRPAFDVSFGHAASNPRLEVKLHPQHFATVRRLEAAGSAPVGPEAVPSDYYLLHFSEAELLEVLLKADEWNSFDVALARQLLHEQGHDTSPARMEQLRRQRLHTLAQPDEGSSLWILMGYLSALLGGLLGVILGWHISSHQKLLPDGTQRPAYSAADRRHGRIMLVLGTVMLVVWLGVGWLAWAA